MIQYQRANIVINFAQENQETEKVATICNYYFLLFWSLLFCPVVTRRPVNCVDLPQAPPPLLSICPGNVTAAELTRLATSIRVTDDMSLAPTQMTRLARDGDLTSEYDFAMVPVQLCTDAIIKHALSLTCSNCPMHLRHTLFLCQNQVLLHNKQHSHGAYQVLWWLIWLWNRTRTTCFADTSAAIPSTDVQSWSKKKLGGSNHCITLRFVNLALLVYAGFWKSSVQRGHWLQHVLPHGISLKPVTGHLDVLALAVLAAVFGRDPGLKPS